MQTEKKKKGLIKPFTQALLFQVLADLKTVNSKKTGRKCARRRSVL